MKVYILALTLMIAFPAMAADLCECDFGMPHLQRGDWTGVRFSPRGQRDLSEVGKYHQYPELPMFVEAVPESMDTGKAKQSHTKKHKQKHRHTPKNEDISQYSLPKE